MHPKVFVKLKKTLKSLSSGQKNPKKPQKKPKKPKKNPKNPLGWVFLKKPGFFPTLLRDFVFFYRKYCARFLRLYIFFAHFTVETIFHVRYQPLASLQDEIR